MFMNSGYGAMGGAKARYQTVDLESRIEGATPHKLIGIMFEELMKSIEIMIAAQRGNNRAKMIEKQARASNILLALETSLDFRNGGEIAANLAKLYRESRRLVMLGGRNNDPQPLELAREYLSGVAEAWEQIG